jgi:hypothetical protein
MRPELRPQQRAPHTLSRSAIRRSASTDWGHEQGGKPGPASDGRPRTLMKETTTETSRARAGVSSAQARFPSLSSLVPENAMGCPACDVHRPTFRVNDDKMLWLAARHRAGIEPTYTVCTGRGGTHLCYRHPENGPALRNTAGTGGPMVDTRATAATSSPSAAPSPAVPTPSTSTPTRPRCLAGWPRCSHRPRYRRSGRWWSTCPPTAPGRTCGPPSPAKSSGSPPPPRASGTGRCKTDSPRPGLRTRACPGTRPARAIGSTTRRFLSKCSDHFYGLLRRSRRDRVRDL